VALLEPTSTSRGSRTSSAPSRYGRQDLSLVSEILFGVLLAGLGWLANLLSDHFPFVCFVFFDSIEKSLALILSKFCIMHVLVPVLLHTSFRSARECLCYICPAVASFPHILKPLLFSSRPWGVGTAFLHRWLHGSRRRFLLRHA